MPLMRSPSPRCFPHEVSLTRNTWGTDADGGRQVVSSVTVRQVDCSVQPGIPEERIETSEDLGLRRVTEIVPAMILFSDNPLLHAGDIITWLEPDSGPNGVTHLYQVKSQRNAGSLGSVWEVRTEEQI